MISVIFWPWMARDIFARRRYAAPECLERKSRGGGVQYYHQAVAAVLVHPDQKQVIPLAVEPIVKQDGETKNDCERNASRRLLQRIRRLYPKLSLFARICGWFLVLRTNNSISIAFKGVRECFLLSVRSSLVKNFSSDSTKGPSLSSSPSPSTSAGVKPDVTVKTKGTRRSRMVNY